MEKNETELKNHDGYDYDYGTFVKVNGGRLSAYPETEPNYPGIRIVFEPAGTYEDDAPAEKLGSSYTLLALVEQANNVLFLRSYMDVTKDEPVDIQCRYDGTLMAQVAYHFYKESCEKSGAWPLDYGHFIKKVFKNRTLMEQIIPEDKDGLMKTAYGKDMHDLYLEAVRDAEKGGGNNVC